MAHAPRGGLAQQPVRVEDMGHLFVQDALLPAQLLQGTGLGPAVAQHGVGVADVLQAFGRLEGLLRAFGVHAAQAAGQRQLFEQRKDEGLQLLVQENVYQFQGVDLAVGAAALEAVAHQADIARFVEQPQQEENALAARVQLFARRTVRSAVVPEDVAPVPDHFGDQLAPIRSLRISGASSFSSSKNAAHSGSTVAGFSR